MSSRDIIHKPIILKEDKKAKAILKKKGVEYVDAFAHQLKELFFIQNTQYVGQPKSQVYKTSDFFDFCKKNERNFVHIYYPWNQTLVKTFPKKEYLTLKTNRNQDLITKEEQEVLRGKHLAVLGMSVGSNIAFVLTQAGISNEITVADFDELDTTNLNRILAGVHQVGLPKVVIASRRIYEDNPFAKVNLMPKGVTEKNLEALLAKKKIDIIIEEIDDIGMKIRTRLLAIKYKVPIVMITDNGDGVAIHIERYDLGYEKIFDKDKSYWTDILKKEITKQVAGGIIMNDIMGGVENVDKKMLRSVERVFKRELVSWSQLGSAAILGGVVATVAVKRIVHGEDTRPYVVEHIHI